ncbi:MAG: riboflavin biosynthesis protein RibF [Bacteroidetes bacterium]|nr:MAG: riboflavin biosynthesis protein RibF [Bacteroidota bacterium]
MKVIRGIKNIIQIDKPVVTVGTFDGLHLGHRKVIDTVKQKAGEINGKSVVVTFWPHPRFALKKADNLKLINTIDEKIDLLTLLKIDYLVIIEFNTDFANLSSYEFIKNILYAKLNLNTLIIGYDHQFGKNREGNFDKLKFCANEFGFNIYKVEPLNIKNINVSSTKIRNALLSGNLKMANKYLDYNFFIIGAIIKGKNIGSKIGFPTANIKVEDYKILPNRGVYAVKVIVDDKGYTGMLNIGLNPTINSDDELKLEVNIFDFSEDIYDKIIKIILYKKFRNEKKFKNLNDLKNQIIKDKNQIIEYFNYSLNPTRIDT